MKDLSELKFYGTDNMPTSVEAQAKMEVLMNDYKKLKKKTSGGIRNGVDHKAVIQLYNKVNKFIPFFPFDKGESYMATDYEHLNAILKVLDRAKEAIEEYQWETQWKDWIQ